MAQTGKSWISDAAIEAFKDLNKRKYKYVIYKIEDSASVIVDKTGDRKYDREKLKNQLPGILESYLFLNKTTIAVTLSMIMRIKPARELPPRYPLNSNQQDKVLPIFHAKVLPGCSPESFNEQDELDDLLGNEVVDTL